MLDTIEEFILVNSKFPHIGEKLEWLWGYEEFSKYIIKLINDSRDGEREGLPREIASALIRLIAIHDEMFPRNTTANSWDDNYCK